MSLKQSSWSKGISEAVSARSNHVIVPWCHRLMHALTTYIAPLCHRPILHGLCCFNFVLDIPLLQLLWPKRILHHVFECLGWKSNAHIPLPFLDPIPSSDGNITGSDVSTNWCCHVVLDKWHLTNWLSSKWRSVPKKAYEIYIYFFSFRTNSQS
jgi:hypothetical protein